MNAENTENQGVANALLEYQRLVKETERKLKKYLKAQAVMDTSKEEWEIAQKAANEAAMELKKVLK